MPSHLVRSSAVLVDCGSIRLRQKRYSRETLIQGIYKPLTSLGEVLQQRAFSRLGVATECTHCYMLCAARMMGTVSDRMNLLFEFSLIYIVKLTLPDLARSRNRQVKDLL